MSPEPRSAPSEIMASLLAMLRRRLWIFLGISLPLAVLGIGAIMLIHPKFDAVTRIQIDPSRNPMTQDSAPVGLNSEAIQTEVGLMTSRELALAVTNKLNLLADPEFAPSTSKPLSANDKLALTVTRVMRGVSVNRDQLSYIIALGFRSRDPQKAAIIANSFARTYLDLRVQSQVGTSSRQAAFFKTRLDALAQDLNATDAQLAAYKAQAGMSTEGTSGTVTDQQITPLSMQLATAQAEAASARSAAQTAQTQVTRGGLDAVAEVRSSAVIGDLRRQRAEIVRNMGEVEARYGPKHPESIRVHDQLAAIDQQIHDEANRVVSSLQAQAQAADAQVASLRATMKQLEGQRAVDTRASAEAERLEREATSKRATYDKMSQLSLDSTQGAGNGIAQAEIVDVAQPPTGPSSPNRPLLSILVLIVATAIGLGIALVLEMLQGGIRTVSEAERRFQLPVLASIPLVGARRRWFQRRPEGSPADSISSRSATLYSEAIRNLRLSLWGRGEEDRTRVIAFTSALPDEGKTTTSLSLARMMAVNGTRTLLVDCDLRNIGLAKALDLPAGPGLVEVLRSELSLDAAVRGDVVEGLDLLTVSTPLFTSEDMFGGPEMARLIEQARGHYKAVILDLPPVLGVADARTLAVQADVSALIVRWGRTSPRAVTLAMSALQSDGVNLAGLVLGMVDPSSEAAGGTYYSRGYHKYYQTA